jgi:Putative DNA-binding domain
VDSFYGTAWEDLDLDVLSAFFAEAESEGLTWEAKGTEQPQPRSVRKHVCAFANSELGGFYIVGWSRENRTSGPWALDPVEFRDEPTTWFSNVIHNGLIGPPWFDVKEWDGGGGKRVAIVRIDPSPDPPCITTSGEVFIRVSGASIPLTDPQTLGRLYARGESRIDRLMTRARLAAEPEKNWNFAGLPRRDPPELRIRVGFSTIGVPDDVRIRVFRPSLAQAALDAAHALPSAPLLPTASAQARYHPAMERDALVIDCANERSAQRWSIRVGGDGVMRIDLVVVPHNEDPRLLASAVMNDAIRPAATTAATLAHALGGSGRAYFVLSVVGLDFQLATTEMLGDVPAIPIFVPAVATRRHEYLDGFEAWTDDSGVVSDSDFARIERELLRSCGITVWEPEDQ